MLEPVDPVQDFEEDEPVMDERGEGVFIDDFVWNMQVGVTDAGGAPNGSKTSAGVDIVHGVESSPKISVTFQVVISWKPTAFCSQFRALSKVLVVGHRVNRPFRFERTIAFWLFVRI